MTEISKSDYRALRQIQTEALDRFCADVLRAIEAVSADTMLTRHERHLRIYDVIRERNDVMARLFDNPRRSQIWLQMFELHQQGYLREADLGGLSAEAMEQMRRMMDAAASLRGDRPEPRQHPPR